MIQLIIVSVYESEKNIEIMWTKIMYFIIERDFLES